MRKFVFAFCVGVMAATSSPAQDEPYKNPDLSPQERADDLLKRLTLKEKISLMQNQSPGVERLGINKSIEREGQDRFSLELPVDQQEFIKELYKVNPNTVVVLVAGSSMAVNWMDENVPAILNAWYPGEQGGNAVAEVLFGDYNPAGKLPVTFYRNVSQLPDFEDYNMTGRTYRYMQDVPLFPFGYGLSYTTFGYGKTVLDKNELTAGQSLKLTVPVTNTGKRNGEEVVQVYLRKQGDAEGPIKTLRAFKRVSIPAGKTVNVEFDLKDKELEWWDDQSNTVRVCPGSYDIMVGGSSKEEDLQRTTVAIK